jgi:hypothetical protein
VQLIKRRRILNVQGIAHYPATLNITKWMERYVCWSWVKHQYFNNIVFNL